jgi:predicted DNA binding CopG/RHH family protein
MTRKIKYTDEPIGDLEVIDDFLPSPDQLVLKDDGVKVTISLSKRSVDFFKAEAGRSKTSYQRMIRRLLDTYAERYTRRSLTSGWSGPGKDKLPRTVAKYRGRST